MKFRINKIIALSAISAVIIAWCVYVCSYGIDPIEALYYAFSVFSLDIKTPSSFQLFEDPEYWKLIYIAGFFAMFSLFATVLRIYLKFFQHDLRLQTIITKGDHIIVIGLGESNRVYIDSELANNNKNIIVVEHDKNNSHLETYREKIGVIVGDGQDLEILKQLNYKKSKHVLISTADDMVNLEIATQLLSCDRKKKLFVHIEDRNLRHFHKKNGILSGENVKVYSYYEDTARELFLNYDIDGEGYDIINSNNPYSIVVIGNTRLAYDVIAKACIMGQLPNENLLTIYCIDKNTKEFQESVELHFPEIMQVPNVLMIYISLNTDTKTFYEHNVWKKQLTNIILCFEEDQKNLDVASNLINLTFASQIADKEMKTNIILALFNNYNLKYVIKNNYQIFRYLYSFGNITDINNREYVISNERDKMAIATDFIYCNVDVKLKNEDIYNYDYNYKLYLENKKNKEQKDDEIIKEYQKNKYIETDQSTWLDLSYFKKESNRAIADHIRIKLKYLGLCLVKSDVEKKKLFFNNKSLFDSVKKDEYLLAKTEHNRWNAFHYLNGYKKINFVSKKDKTELEEIYELKKQHMCLIEFSKFKDKKDELKKLGYEMGKFEGYDFMINEHIPLILAHAGYAIKTPIKLGVTGHRKLKHEYYICQKLKKELNKLSINYKFDEIISPLADGADRLVAELVMKKYDANLITILPFQEKLYKNTFIGNKEEEDDDKLLKKSQEEFDKLLINALNTKVHGEIEEIKDNDTKEEINRKNNHRNECYFNVGKEVVDQCDILIAIWDGIEADGITNIGGTAYVVDYARNLKNPKPILHIYTDPIKIERENFEGLL